MAEDARWDTIRAFVEQARADGHDAGSPVGDAQIEAAERELGAFPEPYRRFVREFGWLEIAGCTVYGLGDDVPPFLDVVRETLAERQDFEPGLDDGYIAIGPDGAGNLWCVETAAAGTPRPPCSSATTSAPTAARTSSSTRTTSPAGCWNGSKRSSRPASARRRTSGPRAASRRRRAPPRAGRP